MKHSDYLESKAGDSAHASLVTSYMERTFLGTTNPRMVRTLRILVKNPLEREKLDGVAACSNGPDLIFALRKMGLTIPCEFRTRRDRDGRACRFGVYHLTDADRIAVSSWLALRRRK